MVRLGGRIGSLLLLVLIAACSTAPVEVDEPVAPPTVKRTQGFIAEAFKAIAGGSPESLIAGYEILADREGLSDYGRDLLYLSSWLYNSLYPALPQKVPVVDPLPGSEYAPLTEDIGRGVYPIVRMEEVSYLFFVLPPLSVYFGAADDTLEIAYESLTVGRELNPGGVLPQFLLGFVEERRGNRDEAITWYISTLQMTTSCYPAALGLARLYNVEGRYEEADIVLTELGELIEETGEYLYLRGETDLGLGRYTEAVRWFTRAMELGGEDARFLLGAARAEFRLREFDAALALLERARRRGGDSPEAVLLEARVLRALDQRLRAMELLSRSQEIYPQNQALRDLYGQLLLETGRTVEGRNVLDDETADLPSDAARLLLLMENAMDAGFWEEALIYYEQTVETVENERVLEAGAEIHRRLGSDEESLELLERLRQNHPGRARYPLEILELAVAGGREELADTMLENLATMDLTPTQTSRLKVFEARRAGSSAARVALYEEALLNDVRNRDALFGLAAYYLDRGERGRARIYLLQLDRMGALSDPELQRLEQLKEREEGTE